MSPRTKYVLFKSRYPWVLVLGLILTWVVYDNGAWAAAVVAAGITVAVTIGTYVKVDRPVLNAISAGK